MKSALLTATDIEQEFGIRAATVRKWRQRGHLRPVGYTRGREHAALYARDDVELAVQRRAPWED